MRKVLQKACLLAAFMSLAACGTVEPPAIPPSDVASYPEITNKGYATHEVDVVFDVPRDWLRDWLNSDTHFVNAMEETENIKKPIETVYLDDNWPKIGAVRRVKTADGHFVLERVIENKPETFQYQIWNMTSAAGQNVDYILGTQNFSIVGDEQTRLQWSYSLKPDASFKKPFVSRFVKSDIAPFLDGATERVVALANETYAAEQQ